MHVACHFTAIVIESRRKATVPVAESRSCNELSITLVKHFCLVWVHCVFCAENAFNTRCTSRFNAPWSCALNQAKTPFNEFDNAVQEDPLLQCLRLSNLQWPPDYQGATPRPQVLPTHWATYFEQRQFIRYHHRLNDTDRTPSEQEMILQALGRRSEAVRPLQG